MLRILLRKIGLSSRDSPVNAEAIIENRDSTIRFRMIEIITLILENRSL